MHLPSAVSYRDALSAHKGALRAVQIVEARVCSLNGKVCDSVAALNSAALVRVTSKNVGAIAADYTLTLSNCSYPAQPVPAQSLALAPEETEELTFEARLLRPHAVLSAWWHVGRCVDNPARWRLPVISSAFPASEL